MNTAVITTKIDPQTKREAQKTAEALGIPLSHVIKALLKNFIKTRTVIFSDRREEIPSKYLVKSIKQAEKNWREGKVSPAFKTGEETVRWLEEQGI